MPTILFMFGCQCTDYSLQNSAWSGVPECGEPAEETTGYVERRTLCGSTPAVSEVEAPWNVAVEWTYPADATDSSFAASIPVVGFLTDDNGDASIGPGDQVHVLLETSDASGVWTLRDLDGATGLERWSYPGSNFPSPGGLALADVDGDGAPEVLAINHNGFLTALTPAGAPIWEADRACLMWCSNIVVADALGDGDIEILTDGVIYSGSDGTALHELGCAHGWNASTAADLDGDGEQEWLCGGLVFSAGGDPLWWTGPEGDGIMFPMVLQADADAQGEVIWYSPGLEIWDSDGTLISEPLESTSPAAGSPCAGDLYGDGETAMVLPDSDGLRAFAMDGRLLWETAASDSTGIAGCSVFDVNGDGAQEVLYADEHSFVILDGTTGTILFADPDHLSWTGVEYPVVADIDGDGHAEILLIGNSGAPALTVYGHAGAGWPPAGVGWGIYDYAVTNTASNGAVPGKPEPWWQSYNMWHGRPAVDTVGEPDLTVTIDSACRSDVGLRLSTTVANVGSVGVSAGVELRVGDDAAGSSELPALAAGEAIQGVLLSSPDDGDTVRATVDPENRITECDESNNTSDLAAP